MKIVIQIIQNKHRFIGRERVATTPRQPWWGLLLSNPALRGWGAAEHNIRVSPALQI